MREEGEGVAINYYPFHIGDYVSATRHLSWEEDAAFRRLLDTYYTTEKPIPADLRAACRLVMAQTDSQREAVRVVLEEFFALTDAGWINKRADAEIDSMRDKQSINEAKAAHETERMRRHRERRAELFAGLRAVGIVPAWDVRIKELQQLHDKHCNGPATDLQREQAVSAETPATAIPTPTPTPTPLEDKDPPTPRKRGSAGADGFDEFWLAYPRKTAKPAALKAFCKLAPSAELLDDLLHAIARQKSWPAWCKDEGQFIPHPATWINGRRWEDQAQAPPAVPYETPKQKAARDRVDEWTGGLLRRQTNAPKDYIDADTRILPALG